MDIDTYNDILETLAKINNLNAKNNSNYRYDIAQDAMLEWSITRQHQVTNNFEVLYQMLDEKQVLTELHNIRINIQTSFA